MLSKAHLTLHSGCLALGEWSHHRDYLGHEDLFLYSSSVYSCHLFLISSASVRSIPLLSFIEPIFTWNVLLAPLIFLKKISSLSHSIAFLYFFALITEESFLISLYYSLELYIQMGISFLFSSDFHFSSSSFFFSTAICKASSDSHFAFLHFFFLATFLIPISCTMSLTYIHSSSGILSDLVP